MNNENFDYDVLVEEILTSEKLTNLIEEKRFAQIRVLAEKLAPADIEELFSELSQKYHTVFFRLLSKELAAETFALMDSELQRRLIESFTDSELSSIVSELYIDDMVDIIEEMPASVVKRIIRHTSNADRATINAILKYPKDSAGSLMTTEYVRFRADMTVSEALCHIREVAIDKETIYTCYVTDNNRRLIGIVTAKRLLISDVSVQLSDIMETSVISVNTGDDREEVARKFDKYGFIAVPVVDSENRLVGIVTVDDAIAVITEESEEDFAKMAAITPTETSYLKTDVISIWRSRIPWLLILMISSTLSSAILTGFESMLPAVLVLFVPMIMGTGGNSGGQSSVTVTRSISLSEISFADVPKVVWKEARVGVLCALTLGVVTFLKVWLVDGMLFGNPEVTPMVAVVVALSLSLTIIVAKLFGASLPLFAKKIGLDPAVMASPLITTLVDAISLVVYFVVASAVLSI